MADELKDTYTKPKTSNPYHKTFTQGSPYADYFKKRAEVAKKRKQKRILKPGWIEEING